MLEHRVRVGTSRTSSEQPLWRISRLCGSRPYRVGESFREGRTVWPEETFYGIDRDGYVLTLFRSGITEPEREAFRRGVAEFALVVEPPLAVLAYRFGESAGWETIPYAWPLSSARPGRYLPPSKVPPGTQALLWVSLVNAEDGLIEAQRGLVLEPSFTLALNEAIRRQARDPFDASSYVRAIATLHADLPSPAALVQRAEARTSSAR